MKNLANTTEQTETQELANIPATGFKTQNTETATERRLVRFNTEGHFKLSSFSIEQLIFGYEHGYLAGDRSMHNQAVVMSRLAQMAIANTYDTEGFVGVKLEYKFVLVLRKWLELRMAHCEEELNTYEEQMKNWVENVERYSYENKVTMTEAEEQFSHNKPITKFNNTTYIAQKNLLLELRLWLCGDIID